MEQDPALSIDVIDDRDGLAMLSRRAIDTFVMSAKTIGLHENRICVIDTFSREEFPKIAKAAEAGVLVVSGRYKMWPQDLFSEYAHKILNSENEYVSDALIPEQFIDWIVTEAGAFSPRECRDRYREALASSIESYSGWTKAKTPPGEGTELTPACFISYATVDQEFVSRLYNQLRAHGIECWYAQEDLKIGDPIRQRIQEAIRVCDKLILVLSNQSVRSNWVEQEVETAFDEENRRGRLILLPLRIDDTPMETDKAWVAAIRRTRNIGDFRDWTDTMQFKHSFSRLLRDLQSAPRSDSRSKNSM
jgi:hypothetical protein